MNTLSVIDKRLHLSFSYNPSLIRTVKEIPGRRWHPESKTWSFPVTKENIQYIAIQFSPIEIDGKVHDINKKFKTKKAIYNKASKIKAKDLSVVKDYKFKTKPFKHQKVCFNFINALKQGALFLEMGTGKTKILIDVLSYKMMRHQIHKVLYVCPMSTIDNAKKEIEKHSPIDVKVVIVSGSKALRIKKLNTPANYYLINYDALPTLLPELMKIAFDVIACDESTRIKNAKAKRSKAAHLLGSRVKYRYVLSGTPVTESPIDIFSQYKFLDPYIYGESFYAFKTKYAVLGGYMNKEITGYRNFEELKDKMFSIAIRYTKAQCLDLPPKVYETREFELNKEEQRLYDNMKTNLFAELKSGELVTATILLTKMLRLSQITSGFVKTEAGKERAIKNSSKIKVLREVIEDILPHKVVIWCRFVHDIEAIQQLAIAMDIKYVSLYGATDTRVRGAVIEKFEKDPETKIFIGQPKTGGMGINLVAASYVVFYSTDYSLEERLQAEDRNHRIGQKNKVTYIDLLAKKTIDVSILQMLKKKKKVSDYVTADNIKDVLEGEVV